MPEELKALIDLNEAAKVLCGRCSDEDTYKPVRFVKGEWVHARYDDGVWFLHCFAAEIRNLPCWILKDGKLEG